MSNPFQEARERAGLTQMKIAAAAGVSQRLVSELDRGHVPRSVILAAKVARAVGLSLDEMFPGAADEDVGPAVDRSHDFDQTAEVIP